MFGTSNAILGYGIETERRNEAEWILCIQSTLSMSHKHYIKHKKYIVLHLFSHFDCFRFRLLWRRHVYKARKRENETKKKKEKKNVDISFNDTFKFIDMAVIKKCRRRQRHRQITMTQCRWKQWEKRHRNERAQSTLNVINVSNMNQASQMPSHASICIIVFTRFFVSLVWAILYCVSFARFTHSVWMPTFERRVPTHVSTGIEIVSAHIRPHICHINRNIVQANGKVIEHNNNGQNRK